MKRGSNEHAHHEAAQMLQNAGFVRTQEIMLSNIRHRLRTTDLADPNACIGAVAEFQAFERFLETLENHARMVEKVKVPEVV